MNILALSGSLRARSINTALLSATARLAVPLDIVTLYCGLGDLPLFNPDMESLAPRVVEDFRAQVAMADALLIASPEYAHGVSGAIKNALDWLVSFPGFTYKPVAVFNTSPRASHADAALRETLRTMCATLVPESSVEIALLGAGLDEEGMLASPAVTAGVRLALEELRAAVDHKELTSTKSP
jgi:chromate reductase, NAD(P)H dehydrogenase (quinone)